MRQKNSVKREALSILLGFFRNQKLEIVKIHREIKAQGRPSGRARRVYLGYLMHNLYCGLEDLFKEIAKTFENKIEDPERYHRELLNRMKFEVPGVRPAFLSHRSWELLDELRGFRHLFRHAYTHELSLEKLEDLKSNLMRRWPSVLSDMTKFEGFLEKKIA